MVQKSGHDIGLFHETSCHPIIDNWSVHEATQYLRTFAAAIFIHPALHTFWPRYGSRISKEEIQREMMPLSSLFLIWP